ncbi:Fasciclin-like arabinogalactan protein 2-like protein [Drosera capensis]
MNHRTTLLLLLLVVAAAAVVVESHNITHILAQFPEFSTFNHYLTITHLAAEINRRETITVCAVDNAAMTDLLGKHLSIYAIKNVLSLHVLLDYFGAKKLHQITDGTALAATMYQATGSAPGTAGFVNITDVKGGKVGMGAEDSGKLDSVYVKSLKEIPYNISVIQISKVLSSPDAEAPTPGPAETNLTSIMSGHGCKVFADTLAASDAEKIYESNLDGGLTVFCPSDDAFKNFLPRYHNLTAAAKLSLLLFHGIPIYESLPMLKSNNGLMNTLATDGKAKFDFTVQNDGDTVTLKTKAVTSTIMGTIIDEQPLAVYTMDKVLLPRELGFKAEVEAPAPAPAKAKAKAKKTKGKKKAEAPAALAEESPADSPDGDVAADEAADVKNGANGGGMGRMVIGFGLGMGLWFGL